MHSALETVKPVRHRSMHEEVYQRMCELILEGNLAPGERLTVASIATAFDVSPMPVREAITRLTASGALTVVAGRSIGVPKLDREMFTDLRNVRLEIEPLCLRWAIKNATPEFYRDLELRLEHMAEAERDNAVKGFIHANYNFHFSIYRQAGSPVLLEIISNIWLRVNPYFHLLQKFGHYKISNEQHREIVAGINSGNADRAVTALVDDINSAYDTMINAKLGTST